ncbi:MAG: VOC family protein [Candidatus Kapabacteria bacterium]|jgi:catechol 2,3-dioxygenase-like lactoylglutathione lyase family enzyme|nr:VOC family protein [Candidatus Kapabacteria bacterium]
MIAIPVLASKDPAMSVAFWKTLGATETFVYGDGVYGGVCWKDVEFHFYRTDDQTLLENSLCRFNLGAIDPLYKELAPHGVIHPNGHPENKPYGYREFSILDPFGVLYTFAERLL